MPSRSCIGNIILNFHFKKIKKHTFWLLCFCALFFNWCTQSPIRTLYLLDITFWLDVFSSTRTKLIFESLQNPPIRTLYWLDITFWLDVFSSKSTKFILESFMTQRPDTVIVKLFVMKWKSLYVSEDMFEQNEWLRFI